MSELVVNAESQFEKISETLAVTCARAQDVIPKLTFPNKEAFLEADQILAEINRAFNHVEEKRKELTKPLDEVKARIMEASKMKTGPLLAMKEALRKSMGAYATDEDRWAESERRKKEDAERKKREDARIALAQAVIDSGQANAAHKADELLAAPIDVPKPMVLTANDEAKSTRRKVWDVEITDVPEFLKGCLAGRAPIISISIDITILKKNAAFHDGKVFWPGAVVRQMTQIGSGR